MGVVVITIWTVLLVVVFCLLPVVAVAVVRYVPRWLTTHTIWLRLVERPSGPVCVRSHEPLWGSKVRSEPLDLAGLEIRPGIGYGPLRLGMRPSIVRDLMGPFLDYDAWDDGNLNDSLIYEGVRLWFNGCDSRGPLSNSRLEVIEVRRPDVIVFGCAFADWTEAELVAELLARGFQPKVVECGFAEFVSPVYVRVSFEDDGSPMGIEIAS